MLWGKSKEGAAPAMTGNCSQEEWRNGKATVKWCWHREKQKMAHKNKANTTGWSPALSALVSNKIWLFICRFWGENYEKKFVRSCSAFSPFSTSFDISDVISQYVFVSRTARLHWKEKKHGFSASVFFSLIYSKWIPGSYPLRKIKFSVAIAKRFKIESCSGTEARRL